MQLTSGFRVWHHLLLSAVRHRAARTRRLARYILRKSYRAVLRPAVVCSDSNARLFANLQAVVANASVHLLRLVGAS